MVSGPGPDLDEDSLEALVRLREEWHVGAREARHVLPAWEVELLLAVSEGRAKAAEEGRKDAGRHQSKVSDEDLAGPDKKAPPWYWALPT